MDARARGRGQLLCALAILIAFGAMLALTAGGGEAAEPGRPSAGPAAKPEGLDPEALARISVRVEPRVARRVERLRGLKFDRIPKPEIVDSDYLNRLSAREARRTGAEQGIGADEAELRMLGLLAPDEQLESIFGSTGDLAAAAYDTESDRLYVVEDAVVANRALIEFVLAHELTHALEDQRFGLSGAGGNDDRALARTALSEGSATAVMIDYGSRYLSPTDLLSASAGLDTGTGGVPKFYVDQLLWTYVGGARFIGGLRALGGGWKLVDYALRSRPPTTTEQVLHTDKYVQDERPAAVRIETRELRSRGWRRADRGMIGELSTSQLLELGDDQSTARGAAQGWGGDRYELWRRDAAPGGCADPCRSDLVLVADWHMDSGDDARHLERALGDYLASGLGAEGDESDGGAAAVRVSGGETALVLAPDGPTAQAVAFEQVAR